MDGVYIYDGVAYTYDEVCRDYKDACQEAVHYGEPEPDWDEWWTAYEYVE